MSTYEPEEALVEVAARAMDENFNPDASPIMAAMFRDYADAVLRTVGPTLLARGWGEGFRDRANVGIYAPNPYREEAS